MHRNQTPQTSTLRPTPPVDATLPDVLETATFALG